MNCAKCGEEIIQHGVGTGYAVNSQKEIICYKCCGSIDAEELRTTGKLYGYFTGDFFTNWPGSLSIPVKGKSVSRNNFGARRTDFWLTWEGHSYHGMQVGDFSECAFIKVLKEKK